MPPAAWAAPCRERVGVAKAYVLGCTSEALWSHHVCVLREESSDVIRMEYMQEWNQGGIWIKWELACSYSDDYPKTRKHLKDKLFKVRRVGLSWKWNMYTGTFAIELSLALVSWRCDLPLLVVSGLKLSGLKCLLLNKGDFGALSHDGASLVGLWK